MHGLASGICRITKSKFKIYFKLASYKTYIITLAMNGYLLSFWQGDFVTQQICSYIVHHNNNVPHFRIFLARLDKIPVIMIIKLHVLINY